MYEVTYRIKGSRSFRCLGSTFTNSGKYNEEELIKTEQARKAGTALNSLLGVNIF
jgi:hypothetical protein